MRRLAWLAWSVIALCLALPPVRREVTVAATAFIGPYGTREDRASVLMNRGNLLGVRRAAARFPGDPAIQFATLDGDVKEDVGAIRRLCARFPQDRMLRAELVQAEFRSVPIGRPELSASVVGPTPERETASPDPMAAAQLLRDADQGQQMDPGNSLYPLARSYAALALGKDRAARDALLQVYRAGTFDDYHGDAVSGQIRLLEARIGPTTWPDRVALLARTTTPSMLWISATRKYSRCIAGWAIQLETAGNTGEAMQLRTALTRLGGLMRRDGDSAMTCLTGSAVEAIGQGGRYTPAVGPHRELTKAEIAQRSAHRLEVARARYTSLHRPDLAVALLASNRAREEVRVITGRGFDELADLASAKLWIWGMGIAVLCLPGLLFLLPPLAAGRPGRWAAVVLVLGTIAWGGHRISMLSDSGDSLAVRALGMAVPLVIAVVPVGVAAIAALVLRKHKGLPFAQGLRASATVLALVLGVAIAVGFSMAAVGEGRSRAGYDASLRGEAQHYARMQGVAWPDAVMPPP